MIASKRRYQHEVFVYYDSTSRNSKNEAYTYQAFILAPPFNVTGRVDAVGKMNLHHGIVRLNDSATSAKPSPLSPKPWQNTMVAECFPSSAWIVIRPLEPSLSTRRAEPNDDM